jgi:hypothetical protein
LARFATEEPRVRGALADDLLQARDAVIGDVGEEANLHGILISETLAGFITGWGCRYDNLDEAVDRATDNFVLALGGTVRDRGVHVLAEGTPITVTAIAHLIAWVVLLDLELDL